MSMESSVGKFHAWVGGKPGAAYNHKFTDTFEQAKEWVAKMNEKRPDLDSYGINGPDKAVIHVSPKVAEVMNLVPVVLPGDKYPRWVNKMTAARIKNKAENATTVEQR